ncbi:hypothetical protein SARC_11165, partial [Sphaeroforma arctica JP610]
MRDLFKFREHDKDTNHHHHSHEKPHTNERADASSEKGGTAKANSRHANCAETGSIKDPEHPTDDHTDNPDRALHPSPDADTHMHIHTHTLTHAHTYTQAQAHDRETDPLADISDSNTTTSLSKGGPARARYAQAGECVQCDAECESDALLSNGEDDDDGDDYSEDSLLGEAFVSIEYMYLDIGEAQKYKSYPQWVGKTLRSNANGAKKPASDLKPQHAAHSASADGTTTTTHGTSGLDEADADDDLDFLEDSDLLALLDSATPSISRADGATAKPITTQTSSKRKSDDTQKENICPVRAKTPRQSPERSRTQRNTPHGAPYQSDGRQAHTEQTHSNRQITRSYVGHSHSQSNESVDGCVGRGRGDDGGALRSGDVRTQNVHAPHRQQQSHPQRTLPQSQMREQARARIQQQPQTSTREQTQTQPANGPLHSPLSQQQPHHIRRQTKHSTPPQLQARRRTQPQQQAQHNPQMNGSLEILLSQPQTTVRQSTTTPQDCLATPNTPAVYSQGLQHLLRTRGSDGEGPGHTLHNSQSNVSLAGQRSGKPSQQRTHSSPHTQQNGIGTRQNTSRQLCVYPQEPTRAEGGCLDTLVRKGAEIPYSSHSSRPPASFRARGTHGAANIETGCVSGSRHQKYLQPTGNITAELVTESTRTETNTHNLISAPRSENRVTNAPNSGTRPSSGPITSGGSGAKYYNLLLDGPRSSSTTRTDVREDEP